MVRAWHILDRPAQDEVIRSALNGDDGGGVVVVGPAGVGKTTLARAVTATLPGAQVHWVACTESSRDVPLGAFAQWVGESAADNPAGQIAAARRALLAGGNVVVGVDDAHLLDPLSATLLHNIATDRSARIVATVRSTEQVPEILMSLWKDGYLHWLELQPFTRRETTALLESVLGGTVEELSADFIWESSEGNPLFLRHLVAGALESGTLRKADDVWQIRGRPQVSAGLAALLETRLDSAGAPALSALKLLALCEPLDLDALVELAGVDSVDAAEQADLIRIADDGGGLGVRIAHPLYGDVIRRRIGTASARESRGRIAEVLRTRDVSSAARRIQLAQLYADSDKDADMVLLLSAGQDALSVADLPLAERLAGAALRQAEKMPASQRGPFVLAARLMLFRSTMLQGRGAEAKAIVDAMTPEDPDDDVQLVRWWGAPLIGIRFFATREVAEAHQVLEMLRSRVTDPAMTAIIEGYDAAIAVQEDRLEHGLQTAEAVLSNPHAPPLAIEAACFAAGQAMPIMGRGKDFEPIAERIRATENPEAMVGILARYTDVVALSMTGDLDRAEKQAAAYAQFSSPGQYVGWALTKVMAAVVASYQGRFADVISPIDQALAALVGEDSLPWQLPAQLLLARAHAVLGRPDTADRVMAGAARHSGAHMAIYGPQVILANAWVAAARGGDRTAIALARKAAESAHEAGQYGVEAEALHDAARFGDRAVSARLSWLAGRVQGTPAELYARHADALARADGTALDGASEQFERAGLLLSAADAAAQAAPAHDRDGRRRHSAESAARAALLAERGGFVTPALAATARPLPLSSREREIAALISAGLTNRQIAERLSVSVRTVEGHIYRGCTKLDASDREEFAAIVRQSGTG